MPSGLYWIGLNITMGRGLGSLRVRPTSKGYTHTCVFMKLEANLGCPSAGITYLFIEIGSLTCLECVE